MDYDSSEKVLSKICRGFIGFAGTIQFSCPCYETNSLSTPAPDYLGSMSYLGLRVFGHFVIIAFMVKLLDTMNLGIIKRTPIQIVHHGFNHSFLFKFSVYLTILQVLHSCAIHHHASVRLEMS